MGLQLYRPRRNVRHIQTRGEEPVGSPHTALEDFPHTEMTDHLIPQVIQHNNASIKVDRVDMTFFQELRSGRRCSCFTVETDPSEDCQICFGSGKAGGFNKRGTRLEMFDWSRSSDLINVVPNFKTRPVTFVLPDEAATGEIHFDVDMLSNNGKVDALQSVWFLPAPTQSSVVVEIKQSDESVYVLLNSSSLQARLGFVGTLNVRVTMSRGHLSIASPIFSHTLWRYELLDVLSIVGDWPKLEFSTTMAEAGFVDTIIAPQIQLDNALPDISSNDFFIRCSDNRRWKVTRAEPYLPGQILVGWQVSLRLIQEHLELNYMSILS